MQKYYFNITDGRRSYPDPVGVRLDSPAAARQHAIVDARALLESWMARSVLPWRLQVYDDTGAIVCCMPLADAAVSEAWPLFHDEEEFIAPAEPGPNFSLRHGSS